MNTDHVQFGFHPSANFQEDTADTALTPGHDAGTAPARSGAARPTNSGVDNGAVSLHDVLTALDYLLERIERNSRRDVDTEAVVLTMRARRPATPSRQNTSSWWK